MTQTFMIFVRDSVANLSWTLSQSRRNGIWAYRSIFQTQDVQNSMVAALFPSLRNCVQEKALGKTQEVIVVLIVPVVVTAL